MAQAYKCDRCKKLKEGTHHGKVEWSENLPQNEYLSKTIFELCPDCYRDIDSAISNPKLTA
jgi:hypothetical protein